MSDSREAYVKWRQDRGIRIGDDPIPATEFWDAAWQAAQAQAGDGEPEAAQDKVIAGALFDFLGFLTTRDKPTAFGATRNASPAVKLLQEWANKRGLDLDGADVEGWRHGAGE